MARAELKRELKLVSAPYSHQIINDDGSKFEIAKPVQQPINGLNTISGDLDVAEATIRAQRQDKEELNAKLVELEELIRQTRFEMERKITVIKMV